MIITLVLKVTQDYTPNSGETWSLRPHSKTFLWELCFPCIFFTTFLILISLLIYLIEVVTCVCQVREQLSRVCSLFSL